MAHEILTPKLCELEEQFSRLRDRIHLSETADHDQLQQEIQALTQECAETERTLRKRLQLSRAAIVTILANTYGEVEQIIQAAKDTLEEQASNRGSSDAVPEEKILLAEYALDFATQSANHALLLAMEAMDAQLTQQETERRLP